MIWDYDDPPTIDQLLQAGRVWLAFHEGPCPNCGIWMGPHEHRLRGDATPGIEVRNWMVEDFL